MAVGTDIAIGLAAVSAVAAAVSASAAARGVALGHRPYVYGERFPVLMGTDAVRLHNDGPGTAVDVRFRLRAEGREPSEWSETIRFQAAVQAISGTGMATVSL